VSADRQIQSVPQVSLARGSGGYQQPRLLVAEDNHCQALVTMHALQHFGYQVQVVRDGAGAATAVANDAFDLILMDCAMPVMDGFQATREIRRLEAELGRQRTPIIALTASVMPDDVRRCLDCGMDDVLAKPFMFDSLDHMVRKWARSRRGSTANAESESGSPSEISER
jgi:CheY-like chemotaxis protein